MSRMNGSLNSKMGREFLRLTSHSDELQEEMRQTPEALKAIEARHELAKGILEAVDNARRIEDLIQYEMMLQRLDIPSAQSQQDKTGVENAQRDYEQLARTVEQLHRNPEEYFLANIALKDTGGDFRKLPRGRVQQIHSNIARLRNRASFALDEERGVWDARVKLAEKTEEMLRTLHKNKARDYERNGMH